MRQNVVLWIVSLLITTGTAYYQRVTGPTYPLEGKAVVDGKPIAYRFERSQSGGEKARVCLSVPGHDVEGVLIWRLFRSGDPWTSVPMMRHGDTLSACLPPQLAAVKLEYVVRLTSLHEDAVLPAGPPVIIRFKGEVPLGILVAHVIAMFGAMLCSTRAGLEIFRRERRYFSLTLWTVGFLVVGGLILGPIVQRYAFGAYWTGWPVGTDLTDNKTLIALIAWAGAVVALKTVPRPGMWVTLAALILIGVFLIPHSLRGSELRPEKSGTGSGIVVSDTTTTDQEDSAGGDELPAFY
ncbi:MAG: hypothetical protein AB1428_06955 [Bacteroidota bacterium]